MNHDPEMLLLAIDVLKKQRDAALERAETAEGRVNDLRFELVHVWNLHRHKPSELLSRIDAVLAATTPEPTEVKP